MVVIWTMRGIFAIMNMVKDFLYVSHGGDDNQIEVEPVEDKGGDSLDGESVIPRPELNMFSTN